MSKRTLIILAVILLLSQVIGFPQGLKVAVATLVSILILVGVSLSKKTMEYFPEKTEENS